MLVSRKYRDAIRCAASARHALPALWDNLDDFDSRMKKLNEATQALAAAAKGGDEGAMKQQFGETVQVCKGCHDEYREKQ